MEIAHLLQNVQIYLMCLHVNHIILVLNVIPTHIILIIVQINHALILHKINVQVHVFGLINVNQRNVKIK